MSDLHHLFVLARYRAAAAGVAARAGNITDFFTGSRRNEPRIRAC